MLDFGSCSSDIAGTQSDSDFLVLPMDISDYDSHRKLTEVARQRFGKVSEPMTLCQCRGCAGGGAWGLETPLLGNSVRTFDFLYEHTHSRRRKAHKNVTFSKFLLHFHPFMGLKFQNFCGGR